jgi:hypothetical protein
VVPILGPETYRRVESTVEGNSVHQIPGLVLRS